jgi:DNA-binding winged helix-turn-helix (wHTH) protein
LFVSHFTDVERGFAVGADDYVKKPFSNRELLARIDYLLKHNKNSKSTTEKTGIKGYSDNVLKVDLIEQTVFLHDKEIGLSPTEYKLLALLASHPQKTLTARRLLTDVWGATYSHDKELLSYYIHKLRQKLKAGEGSHRYISTQWGQGYWFNPLPRPPEPAPKGNQKISFRSLNNRWALIILAGLVLVLFLVAFHRDVFLAFIPNSHDRNTAIEAHVSAEGFMEAGLSGVRGQICVKNTGKYPTDNLSVVNTVQVYSKSKVRYISSAVDLRENPILGAGKSHCYPFGIIFESVSGGDVRYRVTTMASITNHIGLRPYSKFCPGLELYSFGPEITVDFSFPEQ